MVYKSPGYPGSLRGRAPYAETPAPSPRGLTHLHTSDGDVVGLHGGPAGQPRRGLRGADGRGGLHGVDAPIRVQRGPLLQRQLAAREARPGLGPGIGIEPDLWAIGLRGRVPGQAVVPRATRLTLGDHDEGFHA